MNDKRVLKYLSLFLKLKCAPDILAMKLMPNTKEITEAMGLFESLFKLMSVYDLGRSDVSVLVVGDGSTPRLGALIAMRSNWTVHSVDPRMGNRSMNLPIKRLKLYQAKVEEMGTIDHQNNELIVIMPHSHADVQQALAVNRNYSRLHLVAMPCCVPTNCNREPTVQYTDESILSPKNQISIWKDLQFDILKVA